MLLPLHMTLTTWPAIAVQALLVAHVLHLVRRTLLPGTSVWWLLPLAGTMAVATSLPWFAAQLMPDVFTGILVLVLALLILAPDHLSARERIWLVAFAAFMIAAHQSHVLLTFVLLLALVPLRRRLGAGTPLGWAGMARVVAPLALAVIALVSANLAVFGRASVSPFGNVFVLARIIYDGPGMDVLHRDCPTAGWRLCRYIDRFPAISDDFLWRDDGPVALAGGAKLISNEADAIIAAALRAEPVTEMGAVMANTVRQLGRIATGDGLQPWPVTVTPWIERDFPAFEAEAYAAARQTTGGLGVPTWLQGLHLVTALAGVGGCCALAAVRGHHHVRGFAISVLLALLANAAITGSLSVPHDRYQSRVMWLPPLVALIGVVSLRPLVSPAFGR